MSVQHHLISHCPESRCGITLFLEGRRSMATVVVTELPDNPGTPAEHCFDAVIRKVRGAFLKGVPANSIAWVYRRPAGNDGAERLFSVPVAHAGADRNAWNALTTAGLNELVNRHGGFQRRVFIPDFRALPGDAGRRRPKEIVHYELSGKAVCL